ncbi:hypothetical protein D3C71_1572040 [compost metagenome]
MKQPIFPETLQALGDQFVDKGLAERLHMEGYPRVRVRHAFFEAFRRVPGIGLERVRELPEEGGFLSFGYEVLMAGKAQRGDLLEQECLGFCSGGVHRQRLRHAGQVDRQPAAIRERGGRELPCAGRTGGGYA